MIACTFHDARLWLSTTQNSLSGNEFAKILVTLWAIWWARRKAEHEEIFQSPVTTYAFIQKFFADLYLVPLKEKKQQGRLGNVAAKRWLKSGVGVAKINVDVALSRNNDRGVSAAICRDDQGNYLGASATVFDGLTDPEVLEAHACCEAFSLAADLHIQRIKVATDCTAIVNHLQGKFMGISATQRHLEEDVVVRQT